MKPINVDDRLHAESNESQLLSEELRPGDPVSWSLFLKSIYPFITRTLSNLGILSYSDIEDLTQEVFIHFWMKGYSHFDPTRGSIRPYIALIARNVALDFWRKRAHHRTVSLSSLDSFLYRLKRPNLKKDPRILSLPKSLASLIADNRPGPEELAMQKEVRETVFSVINSMPQEEREIIQNLYLDESSPTVVAAALGQSVHWVRVKAREARQFLARIPKLQTAYSDRFGIDPVVESRYADVFQAKLSQIGRDPSFVEAEDPYVVGRPVEGKLFVGRTDILKLVTANLSPSAGRNILLLRGQRRTGKTSVLLRLRDTLAKESGGYYHPVFVDMQGLTMVQNEGELLYMLAHSIWADLRSSGIEIRRPQTSEFQHAAAIAFEIEFLNEVKTVLSDRRILLMLDEFETLKSLIDRGCVSSNVLEYCRHLMQHSPLLFLIAGTQKLRELSGGYWSIFFNLAVPIDIGTLKESESRWLITEPVRRWYTIEPSAVSEIVDLAGCHPFFTQLICKKLLEVRNEAQVNLVSIAEVLEAADRALQSGDEQIGYPWTEDDCTQSERVLLAVMAQECIDRQTVPPAQLQDRLMDSKLSLGSSLEEATRRLVVRGVLREEEKELTFVVPLFQKWLVRKGFDSPRAAGAYSNRLHGGV